MKKKALFIDRDGIINHMVLQKNGSFDSPQSKEQVKLIPGIIEILRWLNLRGIPIIEVSNQPGFALGKMSFETLEEIESHIHDLLKMQNVKVNKIYRCYHHPNAIFEELKKVCDCRKPKSGLLLQAESDLDITFAGSVIIGDNVTDMQAGKNVGCIQILLLHNNDLNHKITANKLYNPEYKVYAHNEIIPILSKLFK